MASKWVDNDDYFGPDRRARRAARFRERRRLDETMQPPSIGATLRRLRVLLGNPAQDDVQDRALHLVNAAIAMAEGSQMRECEAALRRAEHTLTTTPHDLDRVEVAVADAMGYL